MQRVLLRLCVAALGAYTASSGAQRPPVIDVHLHAYPDLPPAAAPIWKSVPSSLLASASAEEHRRATLSEMERHNIVLGVLSGPDERTIRAWQAARPLDAFAAVLGST